YPREVVYRTLRDKLPEVAAFLPDVERIDVKEHAVEGPRVRFVNEWHASAEIPKVAQAFIKPDMLSWTDYALWDETDWSTEWRLETRFFKDKVKVGGRNFYKEEGGRTCVCVRGDLKIEASVPGVPKLLQGKVAGEIERFVVRLITPNLTSLTKGLRKYLEQSR
ncbi:MAG: hypothetical protein K8I02_09830, partial [Candidatus Methylomirabilis sp.]|nr:hypothetical protein [Deltaproteobacteria bacterium]